MTNPTTPPPLRARIYDEEFEFRDREFVTIGRDPAADITIKSPIASRQHAVIRRTGGGWVLEDRSTSGVFRDSERVATLALTDAVTVRLGHATFGDELWLSAGEPAVDTLPPVPAVGAVPVGTPSATPSAIIPLGNLTGTYRASMAERVRIGRAPDNDVVVNDLLVSRHHAEVVLTAAHGYEIVDLKSHNGTFVDGQRVTTAHIDEASVIGFGHHQFRLVGGALELYEDAGRVEFEASNLSVFVDGRRPILDEVSFVLPPDCFLAIVGPSGAGKSTLMKALTGFQPSDEGSVLYGGQDLYSHLEELRPRIGYVPQDDVLHPQLTVRRALEFAAELRFPSDVSPEERGQRVEEVMGELGLGHRANLRIDKLSGGQRKRTSVALELMTKPSLLFLDEPTSGLDPGFEKSAMELMRSLADGGRTVIVVTHSLQSLDLCDRVIFLAPGGSTAFFGAPKEALDYFHRGDYADVFRSLEESEENWKASYAESDLYARYIGRPAALVAHRSGADVPITRTRQRTWGGQLSTLVRRQLAIIAADRSVLALLVLLAPALGLLVLAALGKNGLTPATNHGVLIPNPFTLGTSFGLAFCVAIMGIVVSFREIVKELPILRRERSIGLSLSAYLASKLVVYVPFVVIQAFVFTCIAVLRQHGPEDANFFHFSPLFELGFDLALTGIAALTTGLLISAMVSSSDKAAPIMAALLAMQLLASGGAFDIRGKPLIGQLSQAIATRWGTSAVASSVNIKRLTLNHCHAEPHSSCDQEWGHDTGRWALDLAGLVVISAAGVAASAYFLERRDPRPRKRRR